MKPNEIGRFSLDGDKHFRHDDHQLNYFTPPPNCQVAGECPSFDLKDGYKTERYVEYRKSEVPSMPLLQWMVANKSRFESNELQMPTILTWRNKLAKIMTAPYDQNSNSDWIITAQKLNGTIYLDDIKTQKQLDNEQNMSEDHKKFSYWGYRFERYVTNPASNPTMINKETELAIVNPNEAFVSVLSSKIGSDITLLLAAAMDCRKRDENLDAPDCYVELKTLSCFKTDKQRRNFERYKTLKYWVQSFIVGVPQITCGFRDDDGFISHMKSFSTDELQHRGRRFWDGRKCMSFLEHILTQLVALMQDVNEVDTVVVMSWDGKFKSIKVNVEKKSAKASLPQWYIDAMQNL